MTVQEPEPLEFTARCACPVGHNVTWTARRETVTFPFGQSMQLSVAAPECGSVGAERPCAPISGPHASDSTTGGSLAPTQAEAGDWASRTLAGLTGGWRAS